MLPYILGGAAALALLGAGASRRKKRHHSDPRTAETKRLRIVDSRRAKTLRMARVNPSKESWLNSFMDEVQKLAPKASYNDQGVWVNGHMFHGRGMTPKAAAAETVKQLPRLLKNPRASTTHIEFIIQGNYGYGWDDENTELNVKDARRSLREYRENGSGQYRLIRRRVKNDATNPKRRRKGKKAKWTSPGTAASRLAWWRWHHNPAGAPDALSDVYRKVRMAHSNSDRAQALKKQFRFWSKADHTKAAAQHKEASIRWHRVWNKARDRAHREVFGKAPGPFDYKISGIGRDEYPERYKSILRKAAQSASAHEIVSEAHAYAAKHLRIKANPHRRRAHKIKKARRKVNGKWKTVTTITKTVRRVKTNPRRRR